MTRDDVFAADITPPPSPAGTDASPRFFLLIVDEETPELLEPLVTDLRRLCGQVVEVEGLASLDALPVRLAQILDAGDHAPLVIVDSGTQTRRGVDALIRLHGTARFQAIRKMLVASDPDVEDLRRALNIGALHGSLRKPWNWTALRQALCYLLTEYFIHVIPEHVGRLANLLDVDQLSHAFVRADQTRRQLNRQLQTLQRGFLADTELTDEEVERRMIEGFERALQRPERKRMPPGSILLREGEPVTGIHILLDGQVQLTRRLGEREVVFHASTTGRIIGLLSLSQRRLAFYTCRAITHVDVIPITVESLEDALESDPALSVHFFTVLVRSLANRNRHVAELELRVEDLKREAEQDRDQLAQALEELQKAQTRLVESEKMATLGQLSAGVAHELNNPVAAIRRAADFIRDDLTALIGSLPEGERYRSTFLRALERHMLSTREQRDRREALAKELRDEALARRLARIGVWTREEYDALLGGLPAARREEVFAALERHYQLGEALRNLLSGAERVTALVNSLRSYARGDEAAVAEVNLNECLEDTLLLFNHALRGIQVERHYGEIALIECHAGALNQVWTNLISNAIHALEGKGTLRIETDMPDPARVRVRVIDNGPGIPLELQERIFEPRFTTRQGRVQFGLGLGLAICRQIVDRHGGALEVESRAGHTCFSVILPLRLPAEAATGGAPDAPGGGNPD